MGIHVNTLIETVGLRDESHFKEFGYNELKLISSTFFESTITK